jgi:hypothetical protein
MDTSLAVLEQEPFVEQQDMADSSGSLGTP